ncbi:unnamed protein product, partial [Phaeothamnion confervicola]
FHQAAPRPREPEDRRPLPAGRTRDREHPRVGGRRWCFGEYQLGPERRRVRSAARAAL